MKTYSRRRSGAFQKYTLSYFVLCLLPLVFSPVSLVEARDRKELFFAPQDNGVELLYPQLKWELRGTKLYLDGMTLDSKTIQPQISQVNRENFPRYLRNSDRSGAVVNFSFNWPETLAQTGRLTIESATGENLYTLDFSYIEREKWLNRLRAKEHSSIQTHTPSQIGVFDAAPELSTLLTSGKPMRACFSATEGDTRTVKICSGLFRVQTGKKSASLQFVENSIRPTVFISNKKIGSRGIVNFPPDKPVQIKVVFRDGATVDVTSSPMRLDLLDIIRSKSGRAIYITGQGLQPVERVKILSQPPTHFWSRTGVPEEVVWKTAIPAHSPIIRVKGAFNIPFTLLLKFKSLPKHSDRLHLDHEYPGTYSSRARLYGIKDNNSSVSSKERRAKDTGPSSFAWSFAAPESGKDNRARLMIKGSESTAPTWTAHHKLHRGYPYEASTRLTGVLTDNLEQVFLGEAAASAWMEDLLITDNYYFARQRWGLSGRYFRAVTPIKMQSGLSFNEFSSINMDLKFNLMPGLWNWDELIGVMMSYQSISLASMSAPLVGFGAYWARTMPKVFDDIFNLVPFLRYPKYTDMEFIYFPVSMSSQVKAGASYNLNFHGKVFWTSQFYGEAGFGLKRFEFTDNSSRATLSFAMAYGTAGLGFVF